MPLWCVIMETKLVGSSGDPQSGSRLSSLVFPLDKHRQRPNLFRSTLLKEQDLSWQMVFPHLIKNIIQHLDALNKENKQQLDANETLYDEREWRREQNLLSGRCQTGNHEYNLLRYKDSFHYSSLPTCWLLLVTKLAKRFLYSQVELRELFIWTFILEPFSIAN